MLVYDFQNIGKIKNLKNSEYVEPNHGASIQNIPNTILGGFNYSQYKMIPPHRNESMKTMTELLKLSNTPSDDEFTLKMDKVKESFKELCEGLGLNFPKKKVKELKDAAGSVILDLKYHFNRPRPYQLAEYYGIKLGENILESMKTPSYPSGHSAQGTLIGKVLQTKLPINTNAFIEAGKRISYSRNIGGAHYPSDSEMGENIGHRMYEYIIHKI